MEVLFIVGRIMLGAFVVMSGISHLLKISRISNVARMNRVPFPKFWVFITGVLLMLIGLGIGFWVYIIESLWLFAAFSFVTAFWIHRFWRKTGHDRTEHLHHFVSNLMLAGMALIMIVVI